jgi:rhodanese-related sulfurtransferase
MPIQLPHRSAFHTASIQWSLTTREELVEHITTESKVRVIDVREPHEFAAGFVPTAINIPLGHIEEAFSLDGEDWKLLWGIDKPAEDELVIVYCRSGVRSETARQYALAGGYVNVSNYKGSWMDWEAHLE